MDMQALSSELYGFMIDSDRVGAHRLVENSLSKGIEPHSVIHELLNPALERLGNMWQDMQVSLSQTFVAAKIAEDVLLLCKPESAPRQNQKGPIVIGNIEDDFHSLGRRIVVSFLNAANWEVIDLGNDVPPKDFIDQALISGAAVIGVSAMMQSTARNIRQVRDLLDEKGLQHRIKLAVGGAVFNWKPELVQEVGADGTVGSAYQVDALFDALCREVHP